MAIRRRILRKHYKQQKFVSTTKLKNKITLGKTRKLLLKFLKIKKHKKNALQKTLNIKHWNLLSPDARRKECAFVQTDIRIFAGKYIPSKINGRKKLFFQQYLPKAIWNKMTKKQRQSHLQKRNAFRKQGVNFNKRRNNNNQKVYFANSEVRPLLKTMNQKNKILYLRAIIARAKIYRRETHSELADANISKIVPHKKTSSVIQHFLNFKKKFLLNKKSAFKNIQLVPKKHNKKLFMLKSKHIRLRSRKLQQFKQHVAWK